MYFSYSSGESPSLDLEKESVKLQEPLSIVQQTLLWWIQKKKSEEIVWKVIGLW